MHTHYTVLVCGGRDYSDLARFNAVMGRLDPQPTRIVHGGARGADAMAAAWARGMGIQHQAYPADWKAYGVKAGPIRNGQMLELEKPDLVLAFPGGRGTDDMMRKAHAANVTVRMVRP